MRLMSLQSVKPFVAIIVALLVVVALYQPNESKAPVPVEPLALMPVDSSTNSTMLRMDDALKQAEALLTSGESQVEAKFVSKTSAVQEQTRQDAWTLSNDDSVSTSLPDGVVVYRSVSLDMSTPSYPQPGEQIGLTLPEGQKITVNVKSVNPNPNGDYSWRGYLDGHGTDYPVVMTYGMNSVFATITTPQGSYTLESVNGEGWLYKNPSEFELSKPGKTDYLEIPK